MQHEVHQRGSINISELPGRVRHAWTRLSREQHRAGFAAVAMFISMFLPWYEKTYGAVVNGSLQQVTRSVNAFGAFSFVEAAVLLVALALLVLLFARGERRPFQLPGGDGTVTLVAGAWTTLLIVIRMFDKPGPASGEQGATVGLSWGIFIAVIATATLTYFGMRIRESERRQKAVAPRQPIAQSGADDFELTLVDERARKPVQPQAIPPVRTPSSGKPIQQELFPDQNSDH